MNSTEQLNKLRMTISALYAFKSKKHETDNFVCTADNDKHLCDRQRSSCEEDKLLDSIDKVAEAQIPFGKSISENRAMEENNRKQSFLTDSKDIEVKLSY